MGAGGSRGPLLSFPRSALLAFLPCLFVLFVFFPLLAPGVAGVSIGVNKAKINYQEVLQNGYAEEQVLVTTDSPTPIVGTYQFEGEIAPWLRIDPPDQNFTFDAEHPYPLTVVVEPPADARLQEYSGGIRVLTGELARSDGGKIGTATRAAFLIRVGLGLTGTQRLECRLGGVEIRDTEVEQPFDLLATVRNTGNVRVRPVFNVTVFDQYQTRELRTFLFEADAEILPTVTREFLRQVAHEFPEGQYWAQVTASPCAGGELLTFDVLARGGIADKGELLRVELDPWAETGDIVPVYAVFRNTGSRVVSAKFTGTVTRQDSDRIFKVIDTDRVNVLPGQTARIETFFNPVEPGRYIVAGRVNYNSKLTFQKSAILNVRGPMMRAAVQWGGILLVLIIVILLLLILIARRKRRRHRR